MLFGSGLIALVSLIMILLHGFCLIARLDQNLQCGKINRKRHRRVSVRAPFSSLTLVVSSLRV